MTPTEYNSNLYFDKEFQYSNDIRSQSRSSSNPSMTRSRCPTLRHPVTLQRATIANRTKSNFQLLGRTRALPTSVHAATTVEFSLLNINSPRTVCCEDHEAGTSLGQLGYQEHISYSFVEHVDKLWLLRVIPCPLCYMNGTCM